MAGPRHPVSANAVALVQMERLQVGPHNPILHSCPKRQKGSWQSLRGDGASTFPRTDVCLLGALVRQQ